MVTKSNAKSLGPRARRLKENKRKSSMTSSRERANATRKSEQINNCMANRFKKVKKPVKLLLVGVILAILASFVYFWEFHPVFLGHTTWSVQYKSHTKAVDNILFVLGADKSKIKIQGEVDPSKKGDQIITYSFRHQKEAVKVVVEDTKGPELQVKDFTCDCVGDVTAADFIKSAKDEDKFFVTLKGDSKQAGRHTVTLIAEDESGNKTEKNAVLTRVEDKKPPQINGVKDLHVTAGTVPDYMEGVTAKDDFDGQVKISVDDSNVSYYKPGDYEVYYIAEDRSGNKAKVEGKVHVSPGEYSTDKVVYLTFDDGPSQNTAKILDILKKYGAKATFFVTGNGRGYNSYIKRAYDEGHAIGLHTYTHNYSIYTSEETYFDDLDKVGDMVSGIIGHRPDIIRFAGGSSNTVSKNYNVGIMSRLVKEVRAKGYQYFDWNCSSGDATGNRVPVSTLISNATSCNGHHINILFHDSSAKTTTVEALPAVIEHYKKLGYAFLPLNVDSYPAHHGVNN